MNERYRQCLRHIVSGLPCETARPLLLPKHSA